MRFMHHAEGYAGPNGEGGYDYVYQYRDHLGNNRLSYRNVSEQTTYDFESGITPWHGWSVAISPGDGRLRVDATTTNNGAHARFSFTANKEVALRIELDEGTTDKVQAWWYFHDRRWALRPGVNELTFTPTDDSDFLVIGKDPGSRDLGTTTTFYLEEVQVSQGGLLIVEEHNYYSFGLRHKGYNNVVNGNENKHRTFQVQEWNDELGLNWHSFKWRNYDPTIARFFNIDPLAEDYVYNSPYNFSENRVIDAVELEGLEKVLITDIPNRPQDNGTVGTSYTAQAYYLNEDTGDLSGPYDSSTYPNSVSNTNNSTNSNTLNEGEHNYNNESGHDGGTEKGLNIVDQNGEREAPGTAPNGDPVTMTVVNVHEGASDNGNYNSRGSDGCITICPDDSSDFFSNFNWTNGAETTGDSSGTITVVRGGQVVRDGYKTLFELKVRSLKWRI